MMYQLYRDLTEQSQRQQGGLCGQLLLVLITVF